MEGNTKDVSTKNINIKNYFTLLFGHFKHLVGLNIIFAVPCAVILSAFVGLSYLLMSGISIYFVSLSFILIFPFYAALCHTIVRMINGKKIELLRNFIYGLKDNLVQSLLNGLLFYAAIIMIYSALSLYGYLAGQYGGVMYISLVAVNILIAVAVLFFFMCVCVMTVSFELKAGQIFKNSVLAIFGELKNNFFALCGLIVIFSLSGTLIFVVNNWIVRIVVMTLLTVLFLPSFSTLVYFNLLYNSMVSVISDENEEEKNKQEAKNTLTTDEATRIADEFGEKHNDDDYIFYNGKMIKWGKLKEILSTQNNDTKA